MKTWLLVNIGTRDVQVNGMEMPPETMFQSSLVARLAGEYLLQPNVLAQARSKIVIPMVNKTLDYLGVRKKPEAWKNSVEPANLEVVLFATDQPETVVPRYRNSDTIHYAAIIKDLLFEQYGVFKKQITIILSDNNPSNYDQMHDFYSSKLPLLAKKIGADDQIYLLIVGGTQQMNMMLLSLGAEHLGARTRALYVNPDNKLPVELDIYRQFTRQAVRRSLRILLSEAHAYPAAAELIEQERATLGEQAELLALLRYADQRRNFDFETAVTTLNLPIKQTRKFHERLCQLRDELIPPTEALKVRETIFLAQLADERGDWADFLARLYRFSEGSLQLMADELHVKWGDKKERSSYQKQWWAANQDWLTPLGLAEDARGKPDRRNMRDINTHLANQLQKVDFLAALETLGLIDRPMPLRNDIVHRFTPLSESEIIAKAGCSPKELIAAMRTCYQHQFQIHVPEIHPYREINTLCFELLEGTR